MNDRNALDISVLICTFNRAESLRETLESLAEADRGNLSVEVVVIDNNSSDRTREVAEAFSERIRIRILTQSRPGKIHSLNHALDVGGLGALVVLLDDDMSVHPGWFQGVKSISNRHPDCDYFTGRTILSWPDCEVPAWAHHRFLRPWAFSFIDYGDQDVAVKPGQWLSGNHYWFRSKVLEDGRRFLDFWN
ncbi:MAG: glycosyltransferase family 2 protein, partial [Candidatus Omnitrophica bacterium]|nr:glycosyltransferase family 2 protein [Candidatus Omnitrophota bacterium]